jgi:ribosomal protein S18 acetylase RimI-like enzyme
MNAGGFTGCFEEDVRKTVLEVKRRIGALMDALPAYIENPHDVYQVLNLDKKLGWRIFRIVHEDDIFFAAQFIPGKHSFGRFLKSCRGKGVPQELLDDAMKAVEEFYGLVEVHSGDRQSLDLMLMTSSDNGRLQAFKTLQKSLYQSQSHMLGLQAETQLNTWIFGPGDDGAFSIAILKGLYKLRRNRRSTRWIVHSECLSAPTGEPLPAEPVDPRAGADLEKHAPFILNYCSDPLPEVKAITRGACGPTYELVEGPVGNTTLLNSITGTVTRNVFRTADIPPGDDIHEVFISVYTPVQNLVFDQFVHESLPLAQEPRVEVLGDFNGRGGPLSRRFRCDRLPVETSISIRGNGLDGTYTPLAPDYGDMLGEVFGNLGWDPDEFHLYRVRQELPVVPSTVFMLDRYSL